MKNIYLLVVAILFTISHFSQNVTAQEFEQQFLPEGAKERLGKGWICDIEFSPEGGKFAVATTIGVSIYDSRTGKEDNLLEDMVISGAEALSYSPIDLILAVAHEDMTIRLWNPTINNQERPIPAIRGHTGTIFAVKFSPDGKILASASADNTIRIWNPNGENDREKLIAILPYNAAVRAIAFSPDSQMLAGGSDDGTIQVWDTGTGDRIFEFKGHDDSVQDVDFSTDRTELASASLDGSVMLWSLVGEGANLRSTIQHNSRVYAVKFSPNGDTVATGAADRLIRIWDKNTSEENITFIGHQDIVSNFDFSPDGNAIVSGSPDGRVLFWDRVRARKRYEIPGHTGGIKALTYTEDNRIRACGTGLDGKLRIWDAGTSSALSILREHIGLTQAVTFSKDGKIVASGGSQDGTVFLSNVTKVLESREGFSDDSLLTILTGNTHGITALAFAPEDATLATGGVDGRIHLFDLNSRNRLIILRGPQSTITALTFALDSTRLFSGEENGTVRQWNGLTGNEIGIGFSASFGAITALSYSSINKYLAIGDIKGRIHFFNSDTGNKNTKEFQTLHRSKVTVLIFSEDGNTLVSGSENGTIILWDMKKVLQSPEELAKAPPTGRTLTETNPADENQKTELTAQEIARKARTSTVYLRTLNANRDVIGQGSGFFISGNKIATNHHVIDGASFIYAKLVDKENWYLVESILASDKTNDLAILKVMDVEVTILPIGNSDQVEIGEKVYAIGNPRGFLEGTVSDGIISGIRGGGNYKLIQMTAPISPGSSGGPVLNTKGEVIGIAAGDYSMQDPKTKINRSQNLNVAIPSNYLRALLSTVK